MDFVDRKDAGMQLAKKLSAKGYVGKDVIVYALPRGGVVTGSVVAQALHAPLDICITRKISHPDSSEYAIGALSETGIVVEGPEFQSFDEKWMRKIIEKEKKEIARRQRFYRVGEKHVSSAGKIAIIVDDGVATGLTMLAAIADIKKQHPAKIIIATPVIAAEVAEQLEKEADACVSIIRDTHFRGAIGSYYADFPQISDKEVLQYV